jgi:hypothetical protein
MAIKEEDIKKLFKVIMQDTMKTVSAGQKTVIAPTQVRNIAKEIIAEAESGSIEKFEKALIKTESIIEKLGLKIGDFNKSLGKRIEELRTQRDKSSKEVELLRADNIVAEIRSQKQGKEYKLETHILTKEEIKLRKNVLQTQISRVDDYEQKILKERETILNGEEVTQAQNEKILADQNELATKRADILKEEQTLNPLENVSGDRGPNSSFYEELKAPFLAVGDAFMSIKDAGNEVLAVFSFFKDGGFMKTLKKFKKGLKSIATFLKIPKVLITLAIVGVVAAIYFFRKKLKSAAIFIMGIPETIGKGLKKVFNMMVDFYKTAINTVLTLINKIPGIDIPLLETSKVKNEKETEKQKQLKTTIDKNSKADVVTKTKAKDEWQKIKQMELAGLDGSSKSKIDYSQINKGNDLRVAANDLNVATKDSSALDSGKTVIVNNMANQSNVSSNGAVVSGFVNNNNADDTFLNLNDSYA